MSELALQLIAKEKIERTGKLDLGNCGLTDFPEELFELEWLEELSLYDEYLDPEQQEWIENLNKGGCEKVKSTCIPDAFSRFTHLKVLRLGGWFGGGWHIDDCSVLGELRSLKWLDLSYNNIVDISIFKKLKGLIYLNLGSNKISDISVLSDLKSLTNLDLRSNEIKDLRSLDKLIGLSHLDLSNNPINDFSILKRLAGLIRLSLRSNQISDTRFLGNLTALTCLELSSSEISDYSFLQNLSNLTILDLSCNEISDCSFLEHLTGLTCLDLSGNQISDIHFLDKLTGLTRLDLNLNQISDISIIKKLTRLTCMNLSRNRIEDITVLKALSGLANLDLSFNQISDFSILENLMGLNRLNLRGNLISDLRFLENLTSLTLLELSRNLINDLCSLEKLTGLTNLYLGDNQVSDLHSLEKLTGLTRLDLRINQIKNLRFLEKLTGLTRLDLRSNQISDIQALLPLIKKGISVNLNDYGGEGISLYQNPIITPPLEIIKQGNQAVLNWFAANKKKLNEIKIILLGDPKAGKTSLLKRLKYDTFNENEPQTDGVNIEDIGFGQCETFIPQKSLHGITGHFWDFGGQEIMNATHQFFLTKRAVYVLVLDARNDANNSSEVRKWVKRIRATGDNSPIIVLANQIDVNSGFGFENEWDLQKEFPQIKYFIKVSCSTNENIDVLRNILEEIIPTAELFNTEIDERWIAVKNVLEKETKADNYLNETRFSTICRDAGLPDRTGQRNAIVFLHDLGLVLHFDDLKLAEYYVLDPYWITYGVYQILTSAYVGQMKGKVSMSELAFIVNEEEDKKQSYNPANYQKIEYSTNERRFLIDILNQFKLCFCTADRSEFIIPDLLDTMEPSETVKSIRSSSEQIQFVYEYDYLPKFVMPNIMVEMHKLIHKMWRTGCVLQKDGSQALITTYQNRITIVVTGDYKKKREFMSVIRFVINSINEKLSDKPVAKIPLLEINAFADYERLLTRERNGKKDYIHDEDLPTEKKFQISELLDGIPDDEEVRISGKNYKEIRDRLDDLKCGIQEISAKIDSHYEYLINLPNNRIIKESIYDAMQELNAQQTTEITKEIMEWVTTTFVAFDGEMDNKLNGIYADLKKTDDIQAKLKLSIPFINMLGINFEAEFDVKSWAKKMYQKHELKIFNLLC